MTTPRLPYLRFLVTGAAAWLVSVALLHWLPLPVRIEPRFTPRMAALAIGNCAFFAVLVYFLVRRKPVAERFPATAAIVMPAAFGDAFAVAFFQDFFPTISADASGIFAVFLMLTSAVILATGFIAGLSLNSRG